MMGELSVYERGLGENRVKRLLALGLLISMILICILFSGLNILSIRAAPMVIVVPDDYSTIQEAINNASDGDTVFVKVGTYYEHVIINKTVSLLGEDGSTTIIDGNGTGCVLDLIRDNVNITNFTVRGGGNTMFPDFDAGISLNNSKGCTIASNNVVDNGCFGIHLLNSDQNTISVNNFTRNAMYAIDLTTSNNNTISFNAVTFNVNIAIGMHTTSHDNIITGNTIVNNAYGIDAANALNNKISNNYIANNSEIGIWIQDNANNNSISGNILTDGQLGIQILNSRYTEISNNTIAHNHGSDVWDAGIRLDSAGYTQIHGNEITDNHRGILLYSNSPHVSVGCNIVTENDFGIRVANGGSNYFNATGNVVVNNGNGIGITGWGSVSNYAVISKNLIANNTFEAVGLGYYSNYNTISQNNISQNACGFFIEYSTQNTIFNNNIVNNTQQVDIVSVSVNAWNGSYSSGGNYWNDYNGTDLHCSPFQNESGSDGLGDAPYFIDDNNQDNYPLMGPFRRFSTSLGYSVDVVSNSSIKDFEFSELNNTIRMVASNITANQTFGFCRLAIPHALIIPPYNITINNNPVHYNTIFENETLSIIYFNYEHSKLEIIIIPEFPSPLILLLFIMATILSATLRRRKGNMQS